MNELEHALNAMARYLGHVPGSSNVVIRSLAGAFAHGARSIRNGAREESEKRAEEIAIFGLQRKAMVEGARRMQLMAKVRALSFNASTGFFEPDSFIKDIERHSATNIAELISALNPEDVLREENEDGQDSRG